MAEVEVNGAVVEESEEVTEGSPVKANNKSPTTVEKEKVDSDTGDCSEISSLDKQIIRQVEYYFGDINLPKDKFLQEQIKLDDGWIPLEVMLKFQRLANLSKDMNVIASALKKSSNGLIEVSEDDKKIRRNPERVLPQQSEERRKELMGQTVYCKGFPVDSILDDVLEFFQKYGGADSVIMRNFFDKKTKSSNFKGSVFVMFPTKEKAEEFLELKEVKYGETDLLRMWQADYFEKKKTERKQKSQKDSEKQGTQEKDTPKSFPRGTVLHMKGDFENIARDDLKVALEAQGDKVAYITYSKGDEQCWVRMQEENGAKSFAEKLEDNKFVAKEATLEVRVLEGEEEDTFLNEAMSEMVKRRKSQQNFRGKRGGRGGGRGRGGYQNRKRKQDNSADGPPVKKEAKV